MIFAAMLVAAVSAAAPSVPFADLNQAIEGGRLEQARQLIGRAMAAGAPKGQIDRALADVAFAAGNDSEAVPRYEQLLHTYPGNALLCEKAGIAALRLGQIAKAEELIQCATIGPGPSWRALNALGALADWRGDWAAADIAYARASDTAGVRAEILNNQGWSHLLRGDWSAAQKYLERAAELSPKSERIANNLELARVGLQTSLPERRPGEAASRWAERLNDAGVAARLLGNPQKAVAAFTRALEASELWYARAANNLSEASAGR